CCSRHCWVCIPCCPN
uniref:Conotoxin QcIIIB n=2 Tax=Lividoconus TaxID=1340102 RepID=M3B_CONQU|nr:RecName: Full=Conotoxin QcIIIB [Conus quercinus]